MADSGLGTSRAGGHSNPGGEVLKVDTATCGYCYRGGLSALLPSPAIVTGDGSDEVLSATHNYNWGGRDTLIPSPVTIVGNGSRQVLAITHLQLYHTLTSTSGIVTFRCRDFVVATLA